MWLKFQPKLLLVSFFVCLFHLLLMWMQECTPKAHMWRSEGSWESLAFLLLPGLQGSNASSHACPESTPAEPCCWLLRNAPCDLHTYRPGKSHQPHAAQDLGSPSWMCGPGHITGSVPPLDPEFCYLLGSHGKFKEGAC